MTETPSPMLTLDAFAAAHDVATRTVRRWLDAERIPGAEKVAGQWSIPADAVVDRSTPGTTVARTSSTPALTIGSVLDSLPVFVPLDRASQLLGISEHALRTHADYFELQRFGAQGSYVMPKGRIRQLDGGNN
jgi:hypothetical protein